MDMARSALISFEKLGPDGSRRTGGAWWGRALGLLLVAFLPPSVLCGQSSSGGPCFFEGEVVSAATGDPIAGAQVSLHGTGAGREVLTGSAGHFCIAAVAPGQYFIVTRHKGFVPAYYGSDPDFRAWKFFDVEGNSAFRNLVIRLLPAAEISGHVYDENSRPFQGIPVVAIRERWRGGLLHFEPVQTAQTGSRGYFRIQDLAPGNYFLRAMVHAPAKRLSRHAKNGDGDDEVSYVPFFYPATVDFLGAGVVNLRAGDDRGPFDFHLRPVAAYSIRGRITMPPDAAADQRHIDVELVPQNSNSPEYHLLWRRLALRPGAFLIRGVLPGSYALWASLTAKRRSYHGRALVNVGESDVGGVRLALEPDFDLPGRITLNGSALPKSEAVRVVLSESVPDGERVQSAAVTPDGSFSFRGVSAGSASLTVEGCMDCYVRLLKLGGVPYPPSHFEIHRMAAAMGLGIAVSTDGAQLTGMVVGSHQEPAVHAYVVVLPQSSSTASGGFYRTAFTDQAGQFGIAGLPAGDYLVFAWPSREGAAFEDASFMEQHGEDGVPVTLMAGQIRNLQIALLPPLTPAF
jgi:hypothetical protein